MKSLFTFFLCLATCLVYSQQDSLKHQSGQTWELMPSPTKWSTPAGPNNSPKDEAPDFAGRCNNLPVLQCGGFVTGNTAAAGTVSSFNNTDYKLPLSADFSAPDRAYQVNISSKTSAHFVLDILTTNKDLDLILLSSCGDLSSQVIRKDASLEDNVGEGTYREVLDLNLTPGTYYLIVDGYKADQVGSFKVSMTCTCSCLEAESDLPSGEKLLCDNFQDYLVNKTLSPQSSRWRTFVDTIIGNTHYRTVDGVIRNEGTNYYAQFQDPASSSYADAFYRLDNSTSGRYRVSWKMRVASGKGAYFNILHQTPNGQGNNYAVAYEVFFNSNGTGNLIYYTTSGVKTTIPFKYTNNAWINIVNIIDMDTDKSELWIQDNYVSRWQFSFASSPVTGNTAIKKLAGIEFWETTPTTISQDCCVDDICVWKTTPGCEPASAGSKVCIENGNKDFENPARCALYTSLEWEDCLTVCEYGGTFVYRGTTYSGKLQESDYAPGFVKNDPCVVSAYGGSLPQPLYADVYIFNKQDKIDMQVLLNNQPATCKVFVFACNYRQGNACVYGQKCLTNVGNTHFIPYTCDSLYYIVVTGAFGNTYNLSIVPQGLCQSSATPMEIDCSTPGLTGFFSDNSAVSSTPLAGMNAAQAYSKCYSGSRAYTGGERIYQISLRNPAVVEFQLVPQSPMGVILFTSLCGTECESALREGNAGDTIRFSRLLYANDYYLVIDKATTVGSRNFNLQVECKGTTNNNVTPFVILSCSPFTGENEVKKGLTLPDEYCGCKNGFLGPDSTHTVLIENGAYPFSDKDQMQFLVVKSGSVDTTTSSILYDYYTNIKTTGFPLQKDISTDTVKCSYSVNESLITSIYNKDGGNQRIKLVKAQFRAPNGTNGLNATDRFKLKGISSIYSFSLLDSLSNILFATTKSGLEPQATSTSDNFTLLSNLKWKTQLLPTVDWITNINPKESLTINNGSNTKPITLTFKINPDPKPRQTILKLYAANRPGLIYLYMPVVQQANCSFTPAVTLVASTSQVCKGDTVNLTATVKDQSGKNISDAFAYLWSNGQRTRSIRDTLETTTTGIYSVTVTSPYCLDKTTSTSTTVTVRDLPPSPIANAGTNGTMCLGQVPPTPLSVTSGNPVTTDVQWFDSPSSSTVLTTGTSFTPPQPPAAGDFTYYFQSKYKTAPACVSPRLTAKLTVLPKPTNITVNGKQCADNLLTYGFNVTTLSTNTVTIVAGSGNLTGSNGQYTINNIPKNTPLTFRVTGANGCFEDRTEDGLACPCVAPPKPSPASVLPICFGAPTPVLSVSLPGGNANWVVDWFAQSQSFAGEIPLKSESLTYTPVPAPNTPGIYKYYAETRIKNGTCTSSERTELVLVVNAKPTIQIMDSICEPDLDHYRMTVKTESGNSLTRTPAVGTLSGGGGGVFTITGIPEGANLTLTATNALTGCLLTTTVPSLHCGCDFVSPPGGPSSRTICANAFLDPLVVTVGKDETADWYNQNGDLLLPNSTILPISTGGMYFVLARNTINQCTSALKKITVVINPLPQVTLSAPACATDLLSWSVEFSTVDGTPGQPTPSGSLFSNGTGGYSILNILKNQNVSFTVTNSTTGCSINRQVQAPSCRCEDLPTLPKPGFVKNQTYCPNALTLPALQVKVNVGETADWYDDLGNLVLSGDTLLTPASKGTYFAARRNLTNNCVSAERTAVVLTENPSPTLEVTKKDCALNLLTYEVSVTSNAEALSTTKGTVTGTKPNFKIIGIPKDSNIVVTATSAATGCQNAQPVSAKKCDCDALGQINIPVPTTTNPVTVCSNDPLPTLVVTVDANETAIWYDSLGNQVAKDTLRFRPAVEGAYYVEARNKNSDCKSDTRLTYRVKINAVPNLIFLDSICNDSLNRYDLRLKTNGTLDVLTAPYFKIFDNTTSTYLVPGILLGDPVTLRTRFVSTGCKVQQLVKKDECACPEVAAPTGIKDTIVCEGTFPILTVFVQNPALETVDWFDGNGGLLKANSLTYQHTKDTSRTYYAQTRYRFNGDCVSPARTVIKVIVNKPAEVFAGNNQSVCEGEKVQLNGSINGGVNTGFWSAPVGSFVPGAAVLNAQYQPPAGTGSISLTLVSSDPAGPCPAASDQMTVTVKPKPTFSLVGNSVCAPNLLTYSVTFTTSLTATVNVNTGIKQFLAGGNYKINEIPRDSNLIVTLLEPGSQCAAVFTVATTGCPCSMINLPQAPGDKIICPEDAIPNLTVQVAADQTVDWFDAQIGGNLLKMGSLTFKPQIASTFTYYAQARDTASGCISASRTPVSLTVKPSPAAEAGNPVNVCPGKSATLTAVGSFDTYLWSNGKTTSSINVTPSATGFYYLTVTTNGCRGVDSVLVKVLEAVNGSIDILSDIQCFGDANGEIRANAVGGAKPYKVVWSLNSSQQPQLNNLTAGTYTVTISDQLGCADTVTYLLTQPDALALADTTINDATNGKANGSVNADITGGVQPYSYQWLDEVYFEIPGETNDFIGSLKMGKYALRVTDAHGCSFLTGLFEVKNLSGTHDWDREPVFRLFPNPTDGRLQLQLELPEAMPVEIAVSDITGRILQFQQNQQMDRATLEFDLSTYPSGVYLMRIRLDDQTFMRKVILEK